MKVLVLATSSVSIKLLGKIVDALKDKGNEVRYIMSPKARTFNRVCGFNKNLDYADYINYSDYGEFDKEVIAYRDNDDKVIHVDLAHWADVILVAPATANTMAKLHYGICDNVVMDTLLVASGMNKRIVIAPAMNTNMWKAWQTERNFDSLKDRGVQFVYPTVKKLACGDYGVGALADVKAIVDKVMGVRWKFPVDTTFGNRFIPTWPHLGAFGAVRRFDIHNGVDIYCEGEKNVTAVESGTVVEMGQFTGKGVGSEWWNDTWYITLKGESGYVVYGEIMYDESLQVGSKVKVGGFLGKVVPVLKKNKVRKDIKGHSDHMLHIELKRELVHDGGWPLNSDRPKELLDPTAYLI